METSVNLPFITADQNGPKHLQCTVTRATFESLCGDLFDRLRTPCEQCLKDAKLSAGDIQEVVMAGGSCQIPWVQRVAMDIFHAASGELHHSPDAWLTTSAIGAAIQGGVLQGEVKDVLLLDVTPLSLGIETLGGVMTTLISRNTTIPTAKKEVFSTAADNQASVTIHLLQGEHDLAASNLSIGRLELSDVGGSAGRFGRVEVHVGIDSCGLLECRIRDLASGRTDHLAPGKRLKAGHAAVPPDRSVRLMSDREQAGTPAPEPDAPLEGNVDEWLAYGKALFSSNPHEAAPWIQRAARAGSQEAGWLLIQMMESGQGMPKRIKAARRAILELAEAGHPPALLGAAKMYLDGLSVSINVREAIRLAEQAAEASHGPAMNWLGNRYAVGDAPGIDLDKAFGWYLRAAECGDADAMFNLFRCYDEGRGTRADEGLAMTLLRRAADLNQVQALITLGQYYFDGDRVPRSVVRAIDLLEAARTKGESTRAAMELARRFEQGRGVPRDTRRARELRAWIRGRRSPAVRWARRALALVAVVVVVFVVWFMGL
jgi:TPR repeat protein